MTSDTQPLSAEKVSRADAARRTAVRHMRDRIHLQQISKRGQGSSSAVASVAELLISDPAETVIERTRFRCGFGVRRIAARRIIAHGRVSSPTSNAGGCDLSAATMSDRRAAIALFAVHVIGQTPIVLGSYCRRRFRLSQAHSSEITWRSAGTHSGPALRSSSLSTHECSKGVRLSVTRLLSHGMCASLLSLCVRPADTSSPPSLAA